MIITCEACSTSFNLDDKMLKPTGSKVRCSVCATIFTAFPQAEPAPEPNTPPVESMPVSETPAVAPPDQVAVTDPPEQQTTTPSDEDAGDAPEAETDILEEDAGDLLTEGTDLDFALDDEPEDTVATTEIEDAVSDALESDLADIPVEPEAESVVESDATVIASLDDDDFNLDLSSDVEDGDATATVIANLDDDDLELSADEQSDVAETIIADLDQDDFDLDVPASPDGDPEGTATVIVNLDDDEFDLGGDISLAPDDTDAAAALTPDAAPETMDDLDDLNLTLDMPPVDETTQDAAPDADLDDGSLDDLSLDFDLETDAEPAEPTSAEDAADEDMDLSLDLEGGEVQDAKPAAEEAALEDDLDLSSLEGMFDDDDAIEDDDSETMVVDDAEDLELSLDIDDEPPMPAADDAADPGEALEDLEFNLDGDDEAETVDLGDTDDSDQEIDLSEIEKMLEEPEDGSAEFASVPDQDLDLDIEASLETEKWMSESGEEDQLVMDEELDLSELEQALDDVDTEAVDDTPEDAELELDGGDSLGTPTDTVAVDTELDFDLSDFEDIPESSPDSDTDVRESVDMELEFEVEKGGTDEPSFEDEGLEETVAIPEPRAEKSEAAASGPAEPATAATKPKPVKKGVSKSLVFLLILVILGGGGYGTYYVLNQNGVEIPFLSDYLKPKVHDPGNLKLTTYDISSKFVDNASAGKLFVISGKVKNGYAENRGMVTLAGKIFSTGKVEVNKQRVYCGNIMSDLELANLEWDKIQTRLSNRLGDNRSNVKIEPGKSVSFMVVFSELPEDLEEFTIEVTGSTSLK